MMAGLGNFHDANKVTVIYGVIMFRVTFMWTWAFCLQVPINPATYLFERFNQIALLSFCLLMYLFQVKFSSDPVRRLTI